MNKYYEGLELEIISIWSNLNKSNKLNEEIIQVFEEKENELKEEIIDLRK